MPSKKIIIVVTIIIALIIGTLLSYSFLLKKTAPTSSAPSATSTVNELGNSVEVFSPTATITPAKIKLLSQEPVLNAIIDNNTVKYYSALNGNVFRSGFDGSGTTIVSSDILPNLINVIWSPIDKTKIIAFFEEENQIKKFFYDFKNNQSKQLDENIRYVNWSLSENKIVYQYYNSQSGFNNISIANPDGSGWKNIFETRIKDLIIEWPSANVLVLRTKPSGIAQSIAYTIDTSGKNFKKIIDNTYGLTTLWSPKGDKILYSETNGQGQGLKLKLMNIADQTTRQLDFATLPEKCVWAKDNINIFCAVPKVIADKAILPDDYYKDFIEFSDNFYKINLNTGQKTLLLEPDASTALNTSKLLLNENEQYLIFVNKKDGALYSLKLQ